MPAQEDLSKPKWWLNDPEVLDESDNSYLCETCRHINFKFMLFECPMYSVGKEYEIPLGSYSDVLKRQFCAFCRLVKAAVDNSNAGHNNDVIVPPEYAISLVAFTATHVASHPRNLILWAKPDDHGQAYAAQPTRQIQLVSDEWDLGGSGRGRPINLEQLDYILAVYWVRACRMGYGLHTKESDSETLELKQRLPPGFRLIDVTDMRIVEADSSMQYVTLSYVWPKAPQLRLQWENRDVLMGVGRPLDNPEFGIRIPQTIKDAMDFCRRIEDRYLWVDALCIIQDDDRAGGDKATQIAAMDIIYGASVLTLAATCGDGAEASLPGVRPGSRKIIQRTEVVQGHRLANRPWNFDQSVSESKWNTRAWTFQERVLSKRKLFLTPQMMFFQCIHTPTRMMEDLDVNAQVRKRVTWPMDDTGNDQIPIHGSFSTLTYMKTIENLTSRDITKKCDILNAFKGIEAKMEPIFRSGFLYGLPQSELDWCLMWEPAGEIKRRVCSDIDCKNLGCPSPHTRDPIFPSWSWAGWEGGVTYTLRERLSRVRWVEQRPQAGSELTEQVMFTTAEYRAPRAPDGNSSTDVPSWLAEWHEEKARSGVPFFYHPSDPEAWLIHPTAPGPKTGPTCDPNTPGHLRIEAQTLPFPMPVEWNSETISSLHAQSLANTPASARPPIPSSWTLHISDDDGHLMGTCTLPTQLANEMRHDKKYSAVRIARTTRGLSPEQIRERKDGNSSTNDTSPSSDYKPAKYDLFQKDSLADDDVFTSTSTLTEVTSYPDEPSMQDAANYLPFDRQRYDAYKPFCMYEFLLVERVGEVAYRLGTGIMHVDAWAQEKPTTEVIVLA